MFKLNTIMSKKKNKQQEEVKEIIEKVQEVKKEANSPRTIVRQNG